MWWILLIGFLGFGLLVGLSVYLACKKFFALDATHLLEQAKAKAQAIEAEAQNLLHKKQLELKDMQLSLEQSHKEKERALQESYTHKLHALERKEQNLQDKLQCEQSAIRAKQSPHKKRAARASYAKRRESKNQKAIS